MDGYQPSSAPIAQARAATFRESMSSMSSMSIPSSLQLGVPAAQNHNCPRGEDAAQAAADEMRFGQE